MTTNVFKDNTLEGRVAFITGGGTGIGFGIAQKMVEHGASVTIMGRRKEVLEKAVEKLNGFAKGKRSLPAAFCVTGDVRSFESCENAVAEAYKKYGRLDILVNNAAGNFMCAADRLSPKGFKTVIEIDLYGSFHMAKACHEYLKEQKPGRPKGLSGVIINISATLQYKAMPFQIHAASAKAGIDVMTQTLGVEWGESGIRTLSIAPGPIEGTVGGPGGRVFGTGGDTGGKEGEDFLVDQDILQQVPLGRWGQVEDVANLALFASSDAGSFLNATNLVVDGGAWHGASGFYQNLKELVSSKSREERKSHKGGVKAKL